MIDQIAGCRNITSMQLIQHSQNINQTSREKSQDSRTLSALSREIKNVDLDLMQSVQELKRQGARIIVCEDPEGLELDVKRGSSLVSGSRMPG